MSKKQLTPIRQFWFMVAEYYGIQLTEMRLEMYCADCSDWPIEDLKQAFMVYRNTAKDRRLPLPADLVRILEGETQNDQSIGIEVAGRIITAINRFGAYGWKEAKEYIGEVGEKVVETQGGWGALCELKTDEVNTRQAQLRDLARSMLEKSKVSEIDAPPRFARGQYRIDNLLGRFNKNLQIVKK